MLEAANYLHVIAAQEICADPEARHVPDFIQVVLRVPVAGDLGGVLFIQHGIENRLLG